MRLGRVVGNMITTEKHPAYNARKLLLVQPLGVDKAPLGTVTMALDYVGAGQGDVVLLGAAPGLAAQVFKLKTAPINDLVMGVVDRVSLAFPGEDFGNSVRTETEERGEPSPGTPEETERAHSSDSSR